jgi:hypothetical protein
MLTTKQSHNKKETIPIRKGTRPKTIRGPLHIQCDGSGDGGRFRELIAQVLRWPHVEGAPSLASSPDFISIHRKRGRSANDSAGDAGTSQFAQIYMETPTIVLILPLVAAHWAILRGWAEPHYLSLHGLMPIGTVLLYAPVDEVEREVCRYHFSRAYEFAWRSLEVNPVYPKPNSLGNS